MKQSKYIDHTVLKAETTKDAIIVLCQEAKDHDFASVCVNPTWVKTSADELAGTDVKVCTVIGFPLGANTSATKAFETKDAIANGASEIDMVINIGAAKDGDYELVESDIKAVVDAANGTLVKVIIETALLTDDEIVKTCQAAKKAGAQFVKTSTGFSTAGATAEDVKLMKDTVGAELEVKASGGVRTLEDFEKMIEAGATRIGTSNAITILAGEVVEKGTY